MISLSNNVAQTVAVGASLTFNTVNFQSGCAEAHRPNSGSVSLRCNNAYYEIGFSANIGSDTAATAAQLSIQANGETLPAGTLISTTAAVGDLNNVAIVYPLKNFFWGPTTITVTNTGTTPVTVDANALLFVKRVG